MLELKKIVKIYESGDLRQQALNNVSVNFRKNEFASILGPSGSGKTTLLNIIGGLDKYTSGDLIINGVSTKKYKDSNWDSYRNHRIGFVFQSYNLISHQTVLQNVVLALTLSGISKKEGIRRAKKVLNDVGLSDHIYKRPNQLSGGQMQRVAIARALVNDPDILLADEPTGALDSETSIQIMNLLKKIAKDKLVIMVTHNPELANNYSNRIITLKDGKITSDTNPYNVDNEVTDDSGKTSKTSMSFLTALSLSFNNLMTKKGRTILVSLAGSIGIIGIALILALSTGFQNYIDKLQEDTLTSYPLTIMEESADITSMFLSMTGYNDEEEDTGDIVKERQYVTKMFSSVSKNDLKSFKKHLEKNSKIVNKDVSSIQYSYSVTPYVYSRYEKKDKLLKLNPSNLISSMMGGSNSIASTMYGGYSGAFTQLNEDEEAIKDTYQILEGRLPREYNEMVIVLAEEHSISDMLVYFLGLRDIDELSDMIAKMMAGEKVDVNSEPMEFTYEDLMNIDLRLIMQSDIYKYNSKYEIYEDMSEDKEYMDNLFDNAEKIKIVGILCPKSGNDSMMVNPGVAYSSKLIDHIMNYSKNSSAVKKQLENKKIDVFSNTSFDEEKKKNNMEFEDLISVDEKMLQEAFNINLDEDSLTKMTTGYMNQISSSITADTSSAKEAFDNTLETLAKGLLNDYIANPKETTTNPMMPGVEIAVIHNNDVEGVVSDYLNKDSSKELIKKLESDYVIPVDIFNNTFSSLLNGLLSGYIVAYNANDTSLTTDETNPGAALMSMAVDMTVEGFTSQALVVGASNTLAQKMTEAVMQKEILTKVGELTGSLMGSLASAFDVNPEKIAGAFKFDLSEDELRRIMTAMVNTTAGGNAKSNLISLGYQDKDEPTAIMIYFRSFDAKENFMDFIDKYNDDMKKASADEKVINYTDTTGILMGSVKKIVNSVSYVLIAFVSISLVVSSIMIGIITYISVLERTKEIGILRAIGASKKNISSIFNAETFIIGLLSGLFGIGITLALIPIINLVIHNLTGNVNISATISLFACITLILLSIVLTIIGGLIPSKKASKQDPVIALRSE